MGKVKHLKRLDPKTVYLNRETRHFETQLNEIMKALIETDDSREAWAYVGRYLQVKNELERIEKLTNTSFSCSTKISLNFHREGEKN
jgi:hypothetical protein